MEYQTIGHRLHMHMDTAEGRVQSSVKGDRRSDVPRVCLMTNLGISSPDKSCAIHFEPRQISYLSTVVI